MDWPSDAESRLHNGEFTDGNKLAGIRPSRVRGGHMNALTKEQRQAIVDAGLVPDENDHTQLSAAIRKLAGAYDIPFLAGFTGGGAGGDLAVQLYGSVVTARAITLTGAQGYVGVNPTGAAVEVDIQKNGVSIYTTRPSFAVTTGAFDAGELTSDPDPIAVAAGDRLDFHVHQIGSTIAGQQLRFTLKGEVA